MGPLIDILDLLLRGGAVALLALLAIRVLASTAAGARSLIFAALAFGLADYALVSSPTALPLAAALGRWTYEVPVLNPFLFWWTGVALFDDAFRPRLWQLIPLVLSTVPAFFGDVSLEARYLRSAVVAALYIHLIYVAVTTSRADLVEARRRFRRWFIALAAVFGVVITVVELAYGDSVLPAPVYLLHGATLFLLTLAFALWALPARRDVWPRDRQKTEAQATGLSAADRALLSRLEARMEAGVWREEGLTIGGLAALLDAPEHRLRRVVNQGLGYRNFSTFVNERRIAAACAQLGDPAYAEVPILKIAFACGFSSLGPFNRAFRAETGESPSEYRRRMLADSEKSAPIPE